MRGRGPAALASLLAVGVCGGFAASLASDGTPDASGVPSPVAALSPSYPVDPEPEYAADPDVSPLPTALPMTTGEIGPEGFRYEFPVPADWVAIPNNATTTKWDDPDNPSFTYFLRVEQVDGDNATITETLEDRILELDLAEDDFELLGQTADSVTFSYTAEAHQRFGIVRWLRPSGSPFAEIEIAVTGRAVDLPGMEALVAEVAAGTRAG